ncbi:histidine phosphatase family protein [Bacillus marinisedimentorum]|uniref:histidine phosphatase family protein n=1 Tax=Bacillus marinisedimentorum TaxID=1821260 RepID=UPI0007DEAB4A|nr:histidine phosphatase family protein [Bacillus marinisedimentorum]
MKKIYIVRHCSASGQPPESPLTAEGFKQAEGLAEFFRGRKIDRIISSPFKRARQTAEPLAGKLHLPIEEDPRLAERILSPEPLPNWLEILQESFESPDLKIAGGESSREALERGIGVIEEISKTGVENTVVVTHGNLMALLLKHFDSTFGFKEWSLLTNPDVYLLTMSNEAPVLERIWTEGGAT